MKFRLSTCFLGVAAFSVTMAMLSAEWFLRLPVFVWCAVIFFYRRSVADAWTAAHAHAMIWAPFICGVLMYIWLFLGGLPVLAHTGMIERVVGAMFGGALYGLMALIYAIMFTAMSALSVGAWRLLTRKVLRA